MTIVCILLVVVGAVFAWAFRVLPREDWQILAVVPIRKNGQEEWKGLNLTFYGVFVASAMTLSVALFLFLTISYFHIFCSTFI